MNRGPLIFVGILLAMATSWSGLVFAPYLQLGNQQPSQPVGSLMPFYPVNPEGLAHQGAEVYRSLGCVHCHSQVVRGTAADLQRWGIRRTVAADYLYDDPPLMGSLRIGPDLTNIGARQPDAKWHLAHLYQPRSKVEKSVMPPYPFLFTKRKIQGAPSPGSLMAGTGFIEEGHEVLPTPEAEALVAYLLSRKVDVPLFEAPVPVSKKKAATDGKDSGTNAPVVPTKS